ncbi:MAG: hypothetical protein FD168_1547 [Desulfobulbaceae bacterium]|nr:MAG: hypothetical protein FD168_1547 [Desulfobulbaceae bacterium]
MLNFGVFWTQVSCTGEIRLLRDYHAVGCRLHTQYLRSPASAIWPDWSVSVEEHGGDDHHGSPAGRTDDCRPLFFHVAGKAAPGHNAQHHLQKEDELLAARMEETIGSGPPESSGQHMEHEQVEEILAGDRSGPVFSALGMAITKGDHAIPAVQDVFFADDAPVQIAAEVDKGLITIARLLAVDHPLLGTIMGDGQLVFLQRLEEPVPEDFGQGLVTEEIARRFHPPQTRLHVDARPGHDHMDVGVVIEASGLGMKDGGKSRRAAEFLVIFGE